VLLGRRFGTLPVRLASVSLQRLSSQVLLVLGKRILLGMLRWDTWSVHVGERVYFLHVALCQLADLGIAHFFVLDRGRQHFFLEFLVRSTQPLVSLEMVYPFLGNYQSCLVCSCTDRNHGGRALHKVRLIRLV